MTEVRWRPGRPDEAAALTDLTIRSKAHWGYDEQFLAGRLLRDAVRLAAELDFTVLSLDAGPYAADFYRHRGARDVGDAASGSVPG